MKARIIIILVCVSIFLVGCGSPLVKPKITDSRTFNAAYGDVWRAAGQAFVEKKLPVKELNWGFIATDLVVIYYSNFGETKLDAIAVHPNIAGGIWNNLILNVNAFISSEGSDRTQVKINTYITGYESRTTNMWHICYSKGVIEKNILDTIQSKLYTASPRMSDTPSAQVDDQDRGTVVKVPNKSDKQENQKVQIQKRKIIGYRAKIDPATGKLITYPVYEDEKR